MVLICTLLTPCGWSAGERSARPISCTPTLHKELSFSTQSLIHSLTHSLSQLNSNETHRELAFSRSLTHPLTQVTELKEELHGAHPLAEVSRSAHSQLPSHERLADSDLGRALTHTRRTQNHSRTLRSQINSRHKTCIPALARRVATRPLKSTHELEEISRTSLFKHLTHEPTHSANFRSEEGAVSALTSERRAG